MACIRPSWFAYLHGVGCAVHLHRRSSTLLCKVTGARCPRQAEWDGLKPAAHKKSLKNEVKTLADMADAWGPGSKRTHSGRPRINNWLFYDDGAINRSIFKGSKRSYFMVLTMRISSTKKDRLF